jgi:rSAM/selenodomain-associated transferase 1
MLTLPMATRYPVLGPSVRLNLPRGSCALAVMAKTPQAGVVKTRLVPPLDAKEAALLNICFLQDVTGCIATLTSKSIHGYVAYTPAGQESAFDGLLPAGFRLLPQHGADLGERLLHATEDFLAAGYEAVCLVNSDSPTLPSELLRRAVGALTSAGDRVVLGKAVDGGYYLIGLKKAHRGLFADISWSSSAVFHQTMERVAKLRLEVQLLPAWYDVDDLESLRWLCDELFAGNGRHNPENLAAHHAPHTRNYLRSLIETRGRHKLGLEWPAVGAT